jgi:hypothetical protein
MVHDDDVVVVFCVGPTTVVVMSWLPHVSIAAIEGGCQKQLRNKTTSVLWKLDYNA